MTKKDYELMTLAEKVSEDSVYMWKGKKGVIKVENIF